MAFGSPKTWEALDSSITCSGMGRAVYLECSDSSETVTDSFHQLDVLNLL